MCWSSGAKAGPGAESAAGVTNGAVGPDFAAGGASATGSGATRLFGSATGFPLARFFAFPPMTFVSKIPVPGALMVRRVFPSAPRLKRIGPAPKLVLMPRLVAVIRKGPKDFDFRN